MSILYRLRTGSAALYPLLALMFCHSGAAQTPGAPGIAQFIENRGQWTEQVRFLSRHDGLDLWVADNEIVYDHYRLEAGGRRGHVVRMEFVGGVRTPAVGLEPRPSRVNFIKGSTSVASSTTALTFSSVHLPAIYPGVGLRLYYDRGQPRYDFLVAPGQDPGRIGIRFRGASGVRVDRNGDLLLETSIGTIRQSELFAYQMVGDAKRRVSCDFRVDASGLVGFRLGAYDRQSPLVIDPVIYSTLLGGSGIDVPNAVAVDAGGNAYVVGETSSPDFPFVTGSYYASLRGFTDAFVSKLTADGSTLEYSTFIGGSSTDGATAVILGPSGSVYVAGYTQSRDFPVRLGAIDTTQNGGEDVFLLRLDSIGRTIGYSTYIGGSGDERPNSMVADAAGRIYIAGHTASGNFPTTVGAYQTRAAGGDGFVMKLDTGARSILASTFIGGGNDDDAADVALRGDTVYVAGWTLSDALATPIFPTTTGALQTTFGGATDGFVVALDGALAIAHYATLLGGTAVDEALSIAVDSRGFAAVTGRTFSSDFITTAGALQTAVQGEDAFVTKINPSGTGVRYSTYYGGTGNDAGDELAIGTGARVLVGGRTNSTDMPMTGMGLVSQALGGTDLFLAEFADTSSILIYSSYFGGTGDDSLTAFAFDGLSVVHLTGATSSTDYPTIPGSYDRTPNGGIDGFVTRAELLQVLSPNGGEQLCSGRPQTFTWTGGITSNYEVSVSANGGITWSPIGTGVTGNSFSWQVPASLPAGDLYRVRVRVVGSSEGDISDTVFTISTPPAITREPVGVTIGEGFSASFIAAATGSDSVYAQWQVSADAGATWTSLAGEMARTLVLDSLTRAMDSLLVRARFWNECDTVFTRAALLTVPWIDVTGPVGGETFCAGEQIEITWSSDHIAATTILVSSDGGVNWTVLDSNVPGNSYLWTIPGNFAPGMRYRIRVVQAGTSQPASGTAAGEFEIHAAPVIFDEPEDVTTPPGGGASFTVASSGFPTVAYQWQSQAPGGAWTDVPNATGNSLFVGNLTLADNGTRYRVIIQNPCGADTSRFATLTVSSGTGISSPVAPEAGLSVIVRPTPTTGTAHLAIHTERGGSARLEIFDSRGSRVSSLELGSVAPGDHLVPIDAERLAAGTYRCRVAIAQRVGEAELIVVR